ncbi:unnamed protein product [marine sediment metagenome]|uniref:Uncharacterized protein n=1 Tax=marine sediment metagenome TaxID=412755 RepID=X1FWR6_9ZZZZ
MKKKECVKCGGKLKWYSHCGYLCKVCNLVQLNQKYPYGVN